MQPVPGCQLNHFLFLPKDLDEREDVDPGVRQHARSLLEQEATLVREVREFQRAIELKEHELTHLRRVAQDFEAELPKDALERAETEYDAWRG